MISSTPQNLRTWVDGRVLPLAPNAKAPRACFSRGVAFVAPSGLPMRSNRLAPRCTFVAPFLATLCLSSSACKSDDAKNDKPPPPPPPIASAAQADVCAGGGGQDPDPISGPFVARLVGGYCLDPQGQPKTYGDQGKFSMDEVCTTAFDGECEVYKRFGLDRVVVLRYVDGTGAPNSVEVNLSRFKTPDGAYGMFTKRTVADGDPARATVKPLAAGASGATSSSNAYVWRGA
jgi:hypothetical protein